MLRLREQTSSPDRATARAAALLSAMAPLDTDRLSRRPLPAVDMKRHRATGRIRAGLVLAMSLGSVVATAATLHRAGWLEGQRVLADPAAVSLPAVLRAGSQHRNFGPAVAQAPAPVSVVESQSAAAAGAGVEPVAPVRAGRVSPTARAGAAMPSHATSKETATTTEPSAAAVGPVEDESALVVAGVRALRRDGDPTRAQALAEEALQRYPHGAQVEEAMALAMEAMSARGDLPGARRAAQRYLASFRAGRFADRAARILAAPQR
jgi:hypothetical protein